MKKPPLGVLTQIERSKLIFEANQAEKQATYQAIMNKLGGEVLADFGQGNIKAAFEAKKVEDAIKCVLGLPVFANPERLLHLFFIFYFLPF